ncbi:heparan-alpha-glucosaminide N-acetyltransferase domain-containing protein [Flavobacterium paronense]|uniref:DUF1624 domain-containing protein n=1 Tax=Flavobacterium paronense TaxID=1392775 RepID=A0ABV5GH33_9FLAO|nr:heparan-alpha-glucosaminide N-acetyltransferase domain-containing protein [Flavobacterium paronense]MDN3677256.1 heparan-alpha-glucosaminide N-acetyltransferase domain-containing protein [Flavobacterium paronense]
MTTTLTKYRIESIDLLKGLVMVIMALDHTRDYFHFSAFYFDPTDPTQSTLPIFFTRFITHFCAPAFSFLAGMSAFMVGKRKSKSELSAFLFKRGLWLVFIELTIVNFGWYFDLQFRNPGLLTIWALGISMTVLSAVIHLPRKAILWFSVILIAGHNLLDTIHFKGNEYWSIFHEFGIFPITKDYLFIVGYPIIPWIAVMSLGYYFGAFYNADFGQAKRRKLFNTIGLLALGLFVGLRLTNFYGDHYLYKEYNNLSQDIIVFFNPSKYPPSLLYLLMTIGFTLLFLANSENLKGKVVNFFSTFGRVPFFYYIIHLYVIHLAAMLYAQLAGYGWEKLILEGWITELPRMKGYGVSLIWVYVIWASIILLLYPLCKWFDNYKQSHKDKSWLSYL